MSFLLLTWESSSCALFSPTGYQSWIIFDGQWDNWNTNHGFWFIFFVSSENIVSTGGWSDRYFLCLNLYKWYLVGGFFSMAPYKTPTGRILSVVCLHQKSVWAALECISWFFFFLGGGWMVFIDENCTVCTRTHDFGLTVKSLSRRWTTDQTPLIFYQKTLKGPPAAEIIIEQNLLVFIWFLIFFCVY